MKRIILITLLFIPFYLYAQQKQRPTEEIKSPAEAYDEDMAFSINPKSFPANFIQYGGWITPTLFDQWTKDKKLIAGSVDSRVWLKAYLIQNSFIYLRGKDLYTRIIKNEGYGELDKNDNQLELDLGYAGWSNQSRRINIFAGRKFFNIGTGLVLNGRGDGGQVDFFSGVVNATLFGMYTGLLAEENNPYGLSTKDLSDGSRRAFTGATFFKNILNQTIYVFGIAQFDLQENASEDKTKYDTQYWAAGIRGLIGNSLSYYGEFVYETGKSYNSSGSKDNIRAYAVNAEADYYLDAVMNPTIIVQYAMGSGDKDRSGKTPNGNVSGNDTGFTYFGTFVGGYALKPYLMNIHIIRGGFSLAPFSEFEEIYLNRMFIILKYTAYLKDKKENTLADGGATESNIFVGHGADLGYKWIIFSDLSIFLNAAMFIPASAYSSDSRDKLYFLFGGINLAF